MSPSIQVQSVEEHVSKTHDITIKGEQSVVFHGLPPKPNGVARAVKDVALFGKERFDNWRWCGKPSPAVPCR